MADADVPVKMGRPESFGWVRSRSFDMIAAVAWEMPDGQIVFAPKYDPICVVKIGNERPRIKPMRKA